MGQSRKKLRALKDLETLKKRGLTLANLVTSAGCTELLRLAFTKNAQAHLDYFFQEIILPSLRGQKAAGKMNVLHFAVFCRQEESILQQALDIVKSEGASIDAEDSDHSPLHLATNISNLPAMIFLAKHGADIHRFDSNRSSPLRYAVSRDNAEQIHALLMHTTIKDAANVVDRNNETPLQYIINSGSNYPNAVKILFQYGATLLANCENNLFPNKHPLFTLIETKKIPTDTAIAFIEISGDIRLLNWHGYNPLEHAIKLGLAKWIGPLVKSFPGWINTANSRGDTPLHLALNLGDDALIVEALLDNGASITLNKIFENPADLYVSAITVARSLNRTECWRVLKKHLGRCSESPPDNSLTQQRQRIDPKDARNRIAIMRLEDHLQKRREPIQSNQFPFWAATKTTVGGETGWATMTTVTEDERAIDALILAMHGNAPSDFYQHIGVLSQGYISDIVEQYQLREYFPERVTIESSPS